MEDITIPSEVWTHPVVWWVLVIGVALTVALRFGRTIASGLAPMFSWWEARTARKILRQAEIEAAALILNDQRVAALTAQVAGLTTQVSSLNAQLAAAHGEIGSLRGEIASLRSELAAYRADAP